MRHALDGCVTSSARKNDARQIGHEPAFLCMREAQAIVAPTLREMNLAACDSDALEARH
jgi:hypothetical protein